MLKRREVFGMIIRLLEHHVLLAVATQPPVPAAKKRQRSKEGNTIGISVFSLFFFFFSYSH